MWLEKCGLPKRHAGKGLDRSHKEWFDKYKAVYKRVKGRTDFFFAFLGGRGTGKTQMAAFVAKVFAMDLSVRDNRLNNPIRYCKAIEFFIDLKSTYGNGDSSEKSIIEEYTFKRLLIMDEFHERSDSEWENRMLTHLIDKRYDMGLATILISNMNAETFATNAGPSIYDRLRETGGIVEFNWESMR